MPGSSALDVPENYFRRYLGEGAGPDLRLHGFGSDAFNPAQTPGKRADAARIGTDYVEMIFIDFSR